MALRHEPIPWHTTSHMGLGETEYGRFVAEADTALNNLHRLSRREWQVVALVVLSRQSPADTAVALGIDRATVRAHLMRVREKLGLHGDSEGRKWWAGVVGFALGVRYGRDGQGGG